MLDLLPGLPSIADTFLLAAAEADSASLTGTTSPDVVSLFSIQGLMTLGMLVLLQAVLGFDNLLYISIESKRVPEDQQSFVRKTGIGLAIFFRIALLFVLIKLIALLQESFLDIDSSFLSAQISGHSLIVLGGGAFILWTALKEIYHLLAIEEIDDHPGKKTGESVGKAITLIVVMNLVFSFDSILSAMALTKNEWIMATAIILSGLLMIALADHVAEFLKKNRMYEVLGLFILFIVGIMLVSEGGHLAKLELFGHEVHPMAKSTFYFVLFVLIVVDVVQSRYQKKLLARQKREKAPSL
jgi:predicted tellurium resistance membrane protein TerC